MQGYMTILVSAARAGNLEALSALLQADAVASDVDR